MNTRKKWVIAVSISVLVVLLLVVIQRDMPFKQQYGKDKDTATLEEAYRSLEKELATAQVDVIPFDMKEHRALWERAFHLSEHLYQDSSGYFQKEWGLFLGQLSEDRGIDPYVVYELLKVESGHTFDPDAIGPETRYGQAYGMAQFMENTAPWIAEMADLPYEKELLFHPLYAIRLSVEYLDFLYQQYNDWNYALTAYHRGMGGLESYIARNGHAKSEYAVTIQERAKKHAAQSA
ncbi:lytic transglycosylase domain-containing protein [Shouchella lonarensis]|uniref:Transglycosylase SLT domain-containing protein n=1 Tax=Shouchella lonarensis TaxID=1464122 RepID=A0A1G6KMG8_9BACI|nr:transglycosylase SLT domain-containing protein [Shouchella lonarensis]SDC32164.1 Transglycosylase SLT domain-containing protein [Shouchella lonarensis]